MAQNQVLNGECEGIREEVQKGFCRILKENCRFHSFAYKAGSWSRNSRVICRTISNDRDTDLRYIVTSFDHAGAQYLYETVISVPGDDDDDDNIEDCCEGKVTNLTLRYIGFENDADVKVIQKKNGDVVFNGMVNPGEEFSFEGTDKGTLGTEIIIKVDGMRTAEFIQVVPSLFIQISLAETLKSSKVKVKMEGSYAS